MKAIRFPLMSQKEYLSVVFDAYILTIQEVGDIMKHFNGVLASPLPFIQTARISCAFHRCHRFKKFLYSQEGGWGSGGSAKDNICFTVNKPIKLHAVQHFGSKGGVYKVSTEVKDTTNGSSVMKHSGSYSTVKQEADTYYSFDVIFDDPICLVKGRKYELEALINGPVSWRGADGKTSVECEGVQFAFTSSNNSTNGTSVREGQFPAFVFSKVLV